MDLPRLLEATPAGGHNYLTAAKSLAHLVTALVRLPVQVAGAVMAGGSTFPDPHGGASNGR